VPRLFVAVPLPAEVSDALAALPRPEEPGVRWTRSAQWHITVRFLGSCDLADASAALADVRARSVTVELGPQVSRLGRGVLCVPAHGLDDVAAAVAAATGSIGEPVDPRPFRGHVTLARLKLRGACGLAGTPFSATFVADRVELVESTLGPGGPIYETRLELPLT
jgi:RNA 2',3'-cyclic 3'-phosphodiesterase